MAFLEELLVFLILATFSFVPVDSAEEPNVVKFTESNFSDEVTKTPHFVMFYAPWCGHCKKMTPIWEELGKYYNVHNREDGVTIAKVDCTEETGLCSQYEITGYPTLKFFHPHANVDGGKRYHGNRQFTDLKQFLVEQLDSSKQPKEEENLETDHVIALTEKFDGEITEGFWFVKFYVSWCKHCQALAPTWRDLSNDITNAQVHIAEVDCTVYDFVCRQQKIEAYPTIATYHNGKEIRNKYSGPRDLESLQNYVEHVSRMPLKGEDDFTGVGEEFVRDKQDYVVTLDAKSFDDKIKDGLVLVEYYVPWCHHCQKLAPLWEELSRVFTDEESVTIAKIDCDKNDNKDFCKKKEIAGYPTIILYKNGEFLAEFDGNRDIATLEEFVKLRLGKDDTGDTGLPQPEVSRAEPDEDNIIVLTTDEFHDAVSDGVWFVEFYVPWCPHCTRLAPIWSRISREVKDSNDLYIAKVNCQEEATICDQVNVESYPTIIAYRDGYQFDRYGGPNEYTNMLRYVTGLYKTLMDTRVTSEADHTSKSKRSREPHQVIQLTDETIQDRLIDGLWFVEFYAPWCKHCRALAPIWEEISREVHSSPGLSIAKINCDLYKESCQLYGVNGYPTIIFFRDGIKFDQYGGVLEKESLLRYINGLYTLTAEVKAKERREMLEPLHLDTSNFHEVTNRGWHFVLFYGTNCDDCDMTIDIWVKMGKRQTRDDQLPFPLVDCNLSIDICTLYKVTKYPTMIIIHDGQQVDVYHGQLTERDIFDFYINKLNVAHDVAHDVGRDEL